MSFPMNDLKVSKVLHLSNITHNISRFDILDEIQPIAPVKQLFVLRPNNQALVEMYSSEDALKVYNYCSKKKLHVLGNEVEVKFSRYDQLIRQEDQVAPQCVLLVSIICRDNSTLSLRNFYSICSRFGVVDRIRMFIHQAGPQALVQYSRLYDCIRAKGELEKTTFMYNNRRYSFEVQYSKLRELVIHKNNNYSRDFHLFPLDVDQKSMSSSSSAYHPSSLSHMDHPLPQEEAMPLFPFLQQDNPLTESDSLSGSSQGSPRFANPPGLTRRMTDLSSTSSMSLLSNHQASLYPSAQVPIQPSCFDETHSHSPMFQDYLFPTMLQPKEVYHRHDSDFSNISSMSSLDGTSTMNDLFSTSPLYFEQDSLPSLTPQSAYNTRKYILDGFTQMMPISDLVNFLYGMNIKYAEYQKTLQNYSIIIYAISEWSDTMLVTYLRNNPVNGSIITLRGASEPVSNY